MSTNDSIVVFGRGSSLKRIKELPKDIKQVIIVNDFSQELEHDFIDEYMKDKEIIHFKNWCDDAILQDKLHYDKYNVKRIQVNRNSIYDLAHDQSRYLHLLIAHHYGMELGFCDKKVNEQGGEYKTAGLHAVGYAVIELKKKNIFMCGIDFYDSEYLVEKNFEGEHVPITDKRHAYYGKHNELKTFFLEFSSKFKDINFNLVTDSEYMNKNVYDNINIINRK